MVVDLGDRVIGKLERDEELFALVSLQVLQEEPDEFHVSLHGWIIALV